MKTFKILICTLFCIAQFSIIGFSNNNPSGNFPSFPGGSEALSTFVQSHLIYPEIARELQVEGKVNVSFLIMEDGSIAEPRIEKGLSPECDAAVLDLLELMPNWENPKGDKQHQPIRFKMNIAFELD